MYEITQVYHFKIKDNFTILSIWMSNLTIPNLIKKTSMQTRYWKENKMWNYIKITKAVAK